MYIEHYFPQQSKDEVEMMVEKLKESFLEMLSEETWIDEKTKEQAREKALAMRQFVGYNPDIFNQTAISIKYSTLDIPQNLSSWEVDVRVGKWLADNAYQTLFEKNVLGNFEFLASNVNAYYLSSQNTIAIPVGILQSPFFNATQSIAQNYGAIGTIIGHEITHGFDNSGAQYDMDGNLRNWWDKTTFSNFQTKTQCFVDQYGSQRVENLTLKVNGNMTLGENIADNGGFRAALKAFQKLLRTNQGGSRSSAPELQKYTPLQIFFMSYAYNWCAISRPSYLLDSVPEDSHSPNRIRVNTVISNQPEFEQLFNCPKNSKMLDNPKCTLW
ncbi:unnamed protein product, partial [Mesorhabditis belari]|uniref:Uncharacterized protein n=1 Tax=Mesorhabditis belari TaxID=2138241 RepID=A0AAF3FNH8_9BILA